MLDAGAGRVLGRRAELRVAVREGRRVRARRQAVIRRREREEGRRVEPAGEQKAAHHPCLAEPERIEQLLADQARQIGARHAALGESELPVALRAQPPKVTNASSAAGSQVPASAGSATSAGRLEAAANRRPSAA